MRMSFRRAPKARRADTVPRGVAPWLVTAALLLGTTLVLRADVDGDADLQFQLGSMLFEETRYREALEAFDRATKSDDNGLAIRARKGKVRSALRIAEFAVARQEAETLRG